MTSEYEPNMQFQLGDKVKVKDIAGRHNGFSGKVVEMQSKLYSGRIYIIENVKGRRRSFFEAELESVHPEPDKESTSNKSDTGEGVRGDFFATLPEVEEPKKQMRYLATFITFAIGVVLWIVFQVGVVSPNTVAILKKLGPTALTRFNTTYFFVVILLTVVIAIMESMSLRRKSNWDE